MSENVMGQCACGQVKLSLTLPKPLSAYAPRKCDCDFCMERDAQYLSDKAGQLQVTAEEGALKEERFASEEAGFYSCPSCGTLVAVARDYEGQRLGTVNAKCLVDYEQLQEPIVVSPKQLGAEAKVARWLEVWMPVGLS